MGIRLYQSVYETLRQRILSGDYEPGTIIPSEAGLRAEFGVSAITARRAVHELALDGLVTTRQGVGSIVSDPAETDVSISLASFTSDVADGRLRITRTLLDDKTVRAPSEIAKSLCSGHAENLQFLRRLDRIGNKPVSIDEAWIPHRLTPHITPAMASSPLFMHELQEAAGCVFVRTRYDIRVVAAASEDAHVLELDSGEPLLLTRELVFDGKKRPSLWIDSKYPAYSSRLTAEVTLVQRPSEHGTIGE